jgi:hypothetical protein
MGETYPELEEDFRCGGCLLDAEIASLVDQEAAKYDPNRDASFQESSDAEVKSEDSSEDESLSNSSSSSGMTEKGTRLLERLRRKCGDEHDVVSCYELRLTFQRCDFWLHSLNDSCRLQM